MITEATSRQCALELEALPSRIQQVRRIVAAQLRYWRLDPLLDNTLLGITELLANVHRHARPDKKCQVELTFAAGWLTVAVTDNDPRLPRVREFEPLATCGRGLAMVVSMSDSWGTEAVSDGGKVVWFTLRAEAPTPRRALATPLSVVVREAMRRASDALASVPVRKPVRDPERKPVREPVAKPVREPVRESAGKPLPEPVQESAGKPVRVREIALA